MVKIAVFLFSIAIMGLPILSAEALDITASGAVDVLGCNEINCPISGFTLTGQDFSLVSGSAILNPATPFTSGQNISLGSWLLVPGPATLTFQGVEYAPGVFDPEFGRNFGSLSFSTPLVRAFLVWRNVEVPHPFLILPDVGDEQLREFLPSCATVS